MQAEIEKLISDNAEQYILRDRYGDSYEMVTAVPVEVLRALLANYVLCEKEPEAWMCPDDPECESAFSWKAGKCESNGCGKPRVPLYALADIGKEGGE